ncbi:MAG TPA: hypothetical protein VGH90_00750 [Chthoniobacteraceae bacterium]|jgi:hypothetical protein
MTALASAARIDLDWLHRLEESVPAYLTSLRLGDQTGRYLPCLRGATPVGREMALGWSCFALKIHFMMGLWPSLEQTEQRGWIQFLQSYQKNDGENAFIDPPEVAFLDTYVPWRERLKRWIGRRQTTKSAHAITAAETKQAIATFAEVSAEPLRVFSGFPHTPDAVRQWLEKQDWSRPWGAGGQSAGLVVFLKTQAPKFLPPAEVEALLKICREFYAGLADPETGAYYRGRRPPAHGELINGAMKVLMALDWLGEAPHYPARLIATTVRQPPSPRGCHLVDAVYVLHQCLNGGAPSEEVSEFCRGVFEAIRSHANADGGFSFHRGKAQTVYYGVPVSRGLAESDVQGSCLLVWALALIWRMLAPESAAWKPMRP